MRIDVKIIKGYVKGFDYVPGTKFVGTEFNHVWNLVKIDNEWYLVDVSMSNGYIRSGKWCKKFERFYFLTNPLHLVNTHFPQETQW